MAASIPAFQKHVLDLTFVTAADLSTSEHLLTKLDANNKLILADSLGERVIGPLVDDPPLDEGGLVRILGVAKVRLGATVTLFDRLTANAVAKAITATGSQNVFGTALSDGVVDDIIPVLLTDIGPLT